ncbi:alpha/beta hydrolase [Sphingomonas sp. MMS24-JH45]
MKRHGLLLAALMCSSGAIAQSGNSANAPPPPPPPATTTQPPKAAADMQMVLDQLPLLGAKPIETLSPVKARIQPSAADAARTVMRKKGMSTAPDPAVTTQDLPYGSDPMQYARIYKPASATGAPMPVVVYYHGGGWVIADVNTYDAYAAIAVEAAERGRRFRRISPRAGVQLPAQHATLDAAAAYRWVLQKTREVWRRRYGQAGAGGESAGGNLAVATAIYARDNDLTRPVHVLSVYPIANSSMMLPSRTDAAKAKPLGYGDAELVWPLLHQSMADMQGPRLNLVGELRGLPPTTIVNAQIDPLRSDGETLAAAMKVAGDKVEQRTFPGVTHEFFGMGTVVRGAYDANTYAIARLKAALGIRN